LLRAYFGPEFAIDDELKLECLRVPHFYHAFYVYKYATGMSAAIALADRVLAGQKSPLSNSGRAARGEQSPLAHSGRAVVAEKSPLARSGRGAGGEGRDATACSASARDDYLRFLGGGCSKDPLDLLRDAGVDMEQPTPIDAALGRFGELVDELDRLL